MTAHNVMDRDQVINLMSVITAYDNRNAGVANVLVWTEAARRGRWSNSEAEDAVHQHYLASTDFLMPAHVGTLIRAKRQDAALRQTAAELGATSALPERPEVRRAIDTAAEAWLMDRNHDGLPCATDQQRAEARALLQEKLTAQRGTDAEADQVTAEVRQAALRVDCPWCQAHAFNDCTRTSAGGTARRNTPHPSRVDLATGGEAEVAS